MTKIAITAETYYKAFPSSIQSFTIRRTPSGGVSSDYPGFKKRFRVLEIERMAKTPTQAKEYAIVRCEEAVRRVSSELEDLRRDLEKLNNLPVS